MYEFAEHVEHGAEPEFDLYCPRTHAVHVPPLAPVNPGLHAQAVAAVEPSELFAFELHNEQTESPIESLYFPASHCLHVACAGLSGVKPALHRQFSRLSAALTCTTVLPGHAEQLALPTTLLNCVLVHGTHTLDPLSNV